MFDVDDGVDNFFEVRFGRRVVNFYRDGGIGDCFVYECEYFRLCYSYFFDDFFINFCFFVL